MRVKALACNLWKPIDRLCSRLPEWAVNVCMRLLLFKVFWFSAQTKISGLTVFGQHFAFWNITPTTFSLFDWEYALPLIPSNVAAYLATFGEFFLSLMILFGLLTRFAAIGLMIITLVIQFVYPDSWWTSHAYWLVLMLYLIRNGGGKVSIDRYLLRKGC